MRYQYVNGARRLVQGGGEGGNDRTDDQGNFRLYGLAPGDYYVSASNRNNMMVGPNINNTEPDSFAPTYYPGTASGAEATRITLKAGQEMTGANFALIVARMARVRGRAFNSSGQPVSNAMLMLTPADIRPGRRNGDEHLQRRGGRRRRLSVHQRAAGPIQPSPAPAKHGQPCQRNGHPQRHGR